MRKQTFTSVLQCFVKQWGSATGLKPVCLPKFKLLSYFDCNIKYSSRTFIETSDTIVGD